MQSFQILMSSEILLIFLYLVPLLILRRRFSDILVGGQQSTYGINLLRPCNPTTLSPGYRTHSPVKLVCLPRLSTSRVLCQDTGLVHPSGLPVFQACPSTRLARFLILSVDQACSHFRLVCLSNLSNSSELSYRYSGEPNNRHWIS